jgi:hypothetical protein
MPENGWCFLESLRRPLRAYLENHTGLLAKRRTMSRIIANCSSVSLVCTFTERRRLAALAHPLGRTRL